jgi:TolB protein
MHKLSQFFLIAALMVAHTASAATDIGRIEVKVDGQTIPVRITANSPELEQLAKVAFSAHGRYKVVRGGQAYDFKFSSLGNNQVRVDIGKGAAVTPVTSQIVSGASARNALLRAADVAVEKTNGLSPSLRGFFTARLAFISQQTGKSEVCISDLFAGEGIQLTHDHAQVLSPRWAPDGSRVIYTSYYRTGAPDIFVQQVSGARDTFLSVRGTNTGARFSPNGQQVAMVLTGEGASQIYVRSAAGGAPRAITRSDAVKSSPCWSPDGSQIVFAMDPGPQLYVVPVGGGSAQRVSSGFSYMAEPDWSRADRNKIVCTVRVGGGNFQIAVVDLATRTAKVVSKAPYDAVEPSWLADGRHVVCTMRDRRTSVLAVLDTETGNSYPVSTVNPAMQASVWTR